MIFEMCWSVFVVFDMFDHIVEYFDKGMWQDELIKYWNSKNISCTSTTRFKNRSNCDKSTKKTDGCDGCHKCNLLHNTVFYIHGKYGKSRLRKYEKIRRKLK